jgi:eukaryotic-like serine/threonine-protein kinase
VIGQWFGNYRAVSLLGEGGMGAVYMAEHPSIGRRVAVKVLRKELIRDTQHLGRFVNEARAANSIRHPNIVEILDSGTTEGGMPYLVMELLEGESLSGRLARERLPLAQALEIARQTASALHAAHRQGIVHRDLKPDNLFLAIDTRGEGRERVKVLDFGIAKLQTTRPGDQVKTQTGIMMGTPAYMSPEQCLGTRHVGPRSDIYSLGVIIYEMVCGRPPFWSEAWGALVNMHINQAPESPGARVPDLPPAVQAIILRALAKNPDQRFDNMAELQETLESAMGLGPKLPAGAPPSATPGNPPTAVMASKTPRTPSTPTTMSGSTGEQVAASPGRGGKGRWVAALLLAGAAGGVIYFARQSARRPTAPPPGQTVVQAADRQPAQVVPAPPPPTLPPPAQTVQLGIETHPPGAQVIRASDGVKLGTTPFRSSFPAGEQGLELRLEREGYEPVRRTMRLGRDRDEVITLTPKRPASKPRPRPPAPRPDEPAKL